MIQFLKDMISSISSDLYDEILKPNKSHTNRIIQIVPCKTALILIQTFFKVFIHHEIYDNFFFCENNLRLKIISYFTKKVYHATLARYFSCIVNIKM